MQYDAQRLEAFYAKHVETLMEALRPAAEVLRASGVRVQPERLARAIVAESRQFLDTAPDAAAFDAWMASRVQELADRVLAGEWSEDDTYRDPDGKFHTGEGHAPDHPDNNGYPSRAHEHKAVAKRRQQEDQQTQAERAAEDAEINSRWDRIEAEQQNPKGP